MRQEPEIQKDDIVFALDIGTRSVIGVVGIPRGDILEVLCVETVEHTHRAVVDGQIEDIRQTAIIAAQVKERLERQLDMPLTQVHVAAAGRVLKTKRIRWESEVDDGRPLGQQEIFRLESQAVQKAYEDLMGEIAEEGREQAFYCVGHSIIQYTLDGYPYSTLSGHRGKMAGVELIATFLPNEVVESLYSTMRRVGLDVASITLEPIAAISAVIPKELRLLNIALVDVGAGTSDIAVANGGSVSAYTMATVAGDEITEQIMKELLLDFQMAERVKHAMGEEAEDIEYVDILGLPSSVGVRDLLERVEPAVDNLAATIAQKILEVNEKPPMAVFMVGGGSRTPGLCAMLARHLGIDASKVAIGGNNYMKRLIQADDAYIGAEYATPMGIALTAAPGAGREDFSVTLNGKKFGLQSGGAVTVMELLLRGGFQYGQIMGRSGKSVTFELDGQKRTIRGQLPTLASILVGGRLAGITTPLQAGDAIEFVPAVSGADADTRIQEVVEGWDPFEVTLDDRTVQAGTLAWINGEPARTGRRIGQMDKVRVQRILTLEDLLLAQDLSAPPECILVNGNAGSPMDVLLEPGDRIEILARQPEPPARVQPEPPPMPKPAPNPAGKAVRVTLNGSRVELEPGADGSGLYFFDVLNYVDIDPANPQGNIVIRRNGKNASYIEAIQDGDEIEIYWSS